MIKNIGWTLGNACPCNCKHCYSLQVRERGQNLDIKKIDRIIEQILKLDVETVNFGGNEPIFTNGLDAKKSLLPYIIKKLSNLGIKTGITTSGISLINLKQHFPETLELLNDVDVSIDSPIETEHNKNRGQNTFKLAIEALNICNEYSIDCSVVMCAMNWNFYPEKIMKLLELVKKYNANIRINMLKPTEKAHLALMPSKKQIIEGYKILINSCYTLDMSDPILAAKFSNDHIKGCSCGISSLRINGITAEGKVPVSPCVYMHHFQVGDLRKDDILDIINSEKFKSFKERNTNYHKIEECKDCDRKDVCRGGCAASSYWYNYHVNDEKNMYKKDPYCFYEQTDTLPKPEFRKSECLVHQDYLCTWIGKIK